MNEMRSVAMEQTALAQGFQDQGNVSLLKVADAAMHKLRAATRGALGKVVRFKQCRAQTARHRVDCHAEAGCPAANDDDIPFPFVFQSAEELIAIHETCEKIRGLDDAVEFNFLSKRVGSHFRSTVMSV